MINFNLLFGNVLRFRSSTKNKGSPNHSFTKCRFMCFYPFTSALESDYFRINYFAAFHGVVD